MSATHSHLLAQQQALLQALLGPPGATDAAAEDRLNTLLDQHPSQTARGLQAYQANGHALAERGLLATYPVIAALLGPHNTAGLAHALWHHSPPQRGDLSEWGDTLPAFLQANTQLAELPYLADVARAEWALHRAAGAPDAEADPASFARLASEDPQGLALTLAPGTALVRSRFPVASLVTAHTEQAPPLDTAAQRLRDGVAETALVWRQGHRPRTAAIAGPAAVLVEHLLQGHDLPRALDAACATDATSAPAWDFSSWLAAAVADGLVTGVHDTTHHPTEAPPP